MEAPLGSHIVLNEPFQQPNVKPLVMQEKTIPVCSTILITRALQWGSSMPVCYSREVMQGMPYIYVEMSWRGLLSVIYKYGFNSFILCARLREGCLRKGGLIHLDIKSRFIARDMLKDVLSC
ncbi:Galactinol synthase 4 [Fusarium oxysporum f. sp. albedinis]|nr:Galactinol synthase 4 [Fusarium oxysporum f. sp. albedinis]